MNSVNVIFKYNAIYVLFNHTVSESEAINVSEILLFNEN